MILSTVILIRPVRIFIVMIIILTVGGSDAAAGTTAWVCVAVQVILQEIINVIFRIFFRMCQYMQILAEKRTSLTGGEHGGSKEQDNGRHNGDSRGGKCHAGFGIAGAGIGSL